MEASEALNAKHIKIGDFYNTPCPMSRLVESFAALCAEAENYGATVGFEYMTSSLTGRLKDILEMVEIAGCHNGGIILDIVHLVLLGMKYEELGCIPLRYLINVELNDGLLPGNPNRDPSGSRIFCGEGEYDIKGFISSIQKLGYSGPWAVEVYSKETAAMSLAESNMKAFKSAIARLIDCLADPLPR